MSTGEFNAASDRLLAIDPGHWGSHEAVGMECVRRKLYKRAEQAFLQAQALNPTAPMLQVRLADLYIQTRRYDDAGRAIAKGRELDPRGDTKRRLDELDRNLQSLRNPGSQP